MKIRVEVIRRLDIYHPTCEVTGGNELLTVKQGSKTQRYAMRRSLDVISDYFYHFPMVIDANGSPWTEANRYLLSKLGSILLAKYRTLESIARDLAAFRQWLVDEDIDFLRVQQRKWARPTYRYCGYLHDELRKGSIKASTAKRRMSAVQGFYRWLQLDGVQFDYPLWLENDAFILFKNRHGFERSKSVVSTDLSRSFKISRNSLEYSEYIEDGSKLRPLPKDEQIALVNSLRRVGNIEMLLSFMIALTTGARLQTIFTLRRENFVQWLPKNATEHRIKVGGDTLVNTKCNKQLVLFIPAWLYRRIQVYLQSDRYQIRVKRTPHVYEDEGRQYVFLTRAGKPYYMASNDPFAFLYRSPPRGNAVTQFMRQQLKPVLLANGHEFDFRFHDLRATFGLNLLEQKLNSTGLENAGNINQPEFFQILLYVKERMGHSRISTTEAYLNYRQKFRLALHVQSEYEKYLEELTATFEMHDDLD